MKPKSWTEARRKVESENGCRICGATPAEAAHIIPRSLGGTQNGLSVVPLCREHHDAYDRHRLDLLPYLGYLEQAEAVRLVGIERARKRITGSPSVGAMDALKERRLERDRAEAKCERLEAAIREVANELLARKTSIANPTPDEWHDVAGDHAVGAGLLAVLEYASSSTPKTEWNDCAYCGAPEGKPPAGPCPDHPVPKTEGER